MNHKHRYLMVLLLVATVLSACKKQWDERTTANQELDKNLMQKIQENSNLSTFAGYLTKIGYDKVLSNSKTYTVWAPDNQALQGLDPAIVADTAKLRVFVANHIANQSYLTTNVQAGLRLRTLNGKNVSFTSTMVEESNITVANQYVNNGVLHIINKPLLPKLSIWEFVKTLTTVGGLQKAYLQRQDTTFVDTSKATVERIDPATGKPILVPNTGVVTLNRYFGRVANLANEDSVYTYIILTDNAYNAERTKVRRFFQTVTNSEDTTFNILAGYNVLKDVAIRGKVQFDQLTPTLKSVNGVTVPINKAAVQQTYQASNGIVYVVNSLDFNIAEKITPFVIQGEKPSFFQTTNRRSNTQYRVKKDPNGVTFSDLFLSGADLPANYYVAYKMNNLYTCQYRITWRAVNDIAYTTAPTGTQNNQQLKFGPPYIAPGGTDYAAPVSFAAKSNSPLNYNEVDQTGGAGTTVNFSASGNFLNVLKYGSVNMYVFNNSLNGTGTNLNLNVIAVDYIKLTPIL